MKILKSDNDYTLLVKLQSNVSITGSFIDANQAAIDKLETLVNSQLNNAISSTSHPILSKYKDVLVQKSELLPIKLNDIVTSPLTITEAPIRYAISASAKSRRVLNLNKNIFAEQAINTSIPVNLMVIENNVVKIPDNDTYEYINNYFNVSSFYYVTGHTTSKYNDLLSSYVNVTSKDVTVAQKVGSYINTIENKLNKSSLVNTATASKTLDRSIVPNTVSGVELTSPALKSNIGVALPGNLKSVTINSGNYESPISQTIDDAQKMRKKILIHGTDINGMILNIDTYKEYVLYVGTDYPIKYIDFPDGTTTFMYRRSSDIESNKANIILYPGLIDEPKILNEVFIDRGVNNAFEPVKRLKNVSTLTELIKLGLGYYKMNTKGFNFKNTK